MVAERFTMRFPIYEHLYQLNRNLHETVEILESIRKSPGINKKQKQFHAYQVEIEHLRAEASQDVTEIMDKIESKEAFEFWKQKRVYEKSVADPDDVYFEVADREEERRKKGLPSMIGILRGHIAREEARKTAEEEKEKEEENTSAARTHKVNQSKTKTRRAAKQ
jgi:hypothetical protein